MESIKLENGKYEFQYDAGRLICLRHGEPWRELIGDKAVFSLFCFAQNLSDAVQARDITIKNLRQDLANAKEVINNNHDWHKQYANDEGAYCDGGYLPAYKSSLCEENEKAIERINITLEIK